MTIDKAALLQSLVPTVQPVTVDGMPPLWCRQISVADSAQVRQASKDAAGPEFGLRLLVTAICDETGAPVFTADDLPALRTAADGKISKLVEAALLVNGYTKAAGPNVAS